MTLTIAQQLGNWVGDAIAWTPNSFFGQHTVRTTRNQYGRTYVFSDGSRAFVANYGARVEVRS